MNMHLESMNELVAYRQQAIARDVDAIGRSTFWRDMRIRVGHVLIWLGEALDSESRERRARVMTNPTAEPRCA